MELNISDEDIIQMSKELIKKLNDIIKLKRNENKKIICIKNNEEKRELKLSKRKLYYEQNKDKIIKKNLEIYYKNRVKNIQRIKEYNRWYYETKTKYKILENKYKPVNTFITNDNLIVEL